MHSLHLIRIKSQRAVWYVNDSEDISHAEGQYFQHIWAELGVPMRWSVGKYKWSLENVLKEPFHSSPLW